MPFMEPKANSGKAQQTGPCGEVVDWVHTLEALANYMALEKSPDRSGSKFSPLGHKEVGALKFLLALQL